ncbi:MAG: MBL fold metallo-hydrolase [Pseudomonadota bacterium]
MQELLTGKPVQLSEHVWRVLAPNPSVFTGPGTNSYLIVDGDDVTVLDPGPSDTAHVDALLSAASATGGRIRRIVCTHTHEDHSPGAAPLARETGARLIGSPAPDDGYNDTSFRPDVVPADGEVILAGRLRLRTIATPGHVSNHQCFLLEEEGLLFTGDHLMQGSTVVIVPPEGSMRDYLASLARLEAYALKTIAPGHGHLMPEPAQVVAATIRHRLLREAKTLRALRELGGGTLEELLPRVYDDVPAAMHPIARLSLEAHLIKLVEDDAIRRHGERWHA